MSYQEEPKQHQWSMPEPQIPGRVHNVNGWSQLQLDPLNTDYGVQPDDSDSSAPLRGTFASAGSYSAQSARSSSYYDAESAAAFWAFPDIAPESEVMSPQAYDDRAAAPSMQQRASDRSTAVSQGEDYPQESDDDRRSVNSFATAPMNAMYVGDDFSKQMSQLQLQQEGLERFQEGTLPEEDEEWHRLCSETARESLPKKEVQRQSVLFEVVKSERDYVLDMQMVEQVFMVPLMAAHPPIIAPPEELQDFIREVFSNILEIEKIHEKMVASLFRRQLREHPIITSISDIVLDASVHFQECYETYIKHYPIAESRHREMLKANPSYAQFIQKCSHDTRIRKRDLITLLSRPVTRLPRLALMLEHINKLTPEDHPDRETLPLILGILQQFLKSTQPGIAAAESKVKLRNLIESLVFDKGELIDLDPSSETRSMIYSGTLARQDVRGWEPDRYGWLDVTVSLLDNYLIMTRPEVRAGITRYVVVSRPIPLDFLRLDSFSLPAEQRKVDSPEDGPKSPSKGRSILGLGRLFKDSVPVYPFMIHHASLHSKRRYTLFANSEATRKKWRDAFDEAIVIRKTQQEANQLFVTESITDDFFRSVTALVPTSSPLRKKPEAFPGKITSATRFTSGGRNCVLIGCELGIYMCYSGQLRDIRKVIGLPNPAAMASLQEQGELIVLHDGALWAFHLDDVVKAMDSRRVLLITSGKRLDTTDGSVTLLRVGRLSGRLIICYAVKSFRQQTINILEPVGGQIQMPPSPATPSPAVAMRSAVSYRPYGAPFYVPRDASSITLLKRTIAVAADHSLVVVNPTLAASERRVTTVPDFSGCGSSPALTRLKNMCQESIPLGVVWAAETERLVIFETFGTYVSKYGYPTRNRTYIRFETKVVSWVVRPPYILLISPGWIEVRHLATARLEQVITGVDIRMVQVAEPDNGALLLAMKGSRDDSGGLSDKLVEVLETRPLTIGGGPDETSSDPQWGEWDI